MPLIEVRGLTKSYQTANTTVGVLRDLDVSVEKGEMVAIVGASGVGKSTLLHVLGGLDSIDAGSIRIADRALRELSDAELVAFRNHHVGFVGTAAGAIAGYGLIFLLDRYKLISVPVDVYQISYVPFKLQPLDFIVVIVSAILICFVATIYPSRQAARLDPAQALRYQ